jgi:hypothetical protein
MTVNLSDLAFELHFVRLTCHVLCAPFIQWRFLQGIELVVGVRGRKPHETYIDRPPYVIPSPTTTVNWNSRLPREFRLAVQDSPACETQLEGNLYIPRDDYVRYLGEQVKVSGNGRDGGTRYSTLPQKLLKRFYEHSCFSVSCRSSVWVSEKICTCAKPSCNFYGSQHKALPFWACKPAEAFVYWRPTDWIRNIITCRDGNTFWNPK